MREDILRRKQEIVTWVQDNKPKAFICRQLQCKAETLDSYLIKMQIPYSGNKARKGIKRPRLTAVDYSKGTCVKSHKLKLKLIDDGLKEHRCEDCKNTIWNGKPIPLELHHIDGNHHNNDIVTNIKLLCPNCHAQCDNNAGSARKNARVV